ncbi:MAG: DUF4332 domain-containing protein [Desulfobacterales bacterium]|nr:DUF4332 domain-containing protein [Desulfobacterales bacterium]
MRRGFPTHGVIGIIILIVSWTLHFEKVEPFYRWFYCFAWWSYILTLDALIFYMKGNSLILNRRKEFFLMIPWSIFIWLIFEAANLVLGNWYYINVPHSVFERWLGYAIAYGTVLPGLFETTEFLASAGFFKDSTTRKIPLSSRTLLFMVILGVFSLASSLLLPRYCFSLIWVGFIFLLEPLNYLFGGRSLLRDLEKGKPGKVYLLLMAGLICGFLWELWNFWALAKWIYTVPFFERMKGFEMPFLGFLGFPPFAIESYVMYNFVSLFRFQRGWEESSHRPSEEKTRPLMIALMTIFMLSFFVLIFSEIDRKTVDSHESRLTDAYWIHPYYLAELPRVGIADLEDLLSKTGEKREREELALRLLIPKEELLGWIDRAELAQLKGIGIENLRLLEVAGIHSVSSLAGEDPEKLEERIRRAYPSDRLPQKARLRIWIREARRKVTGES